MRKRYDLTFANTFVCSKCIRRIAGTPRSDGAQRLYNTHAANPASSSSYPRRRIARPSQIYPAYIYADTLNFLSAPSPLPSRRYATSAAERPSHEFAVLGAGITGLATAHYLTKAFPNARISIFESSSRLGGWIQSSHEGSGGDKVLFESGPRSLRPQGASALLTMQLIQDLDLTDDVVFVPKWAPAAQNRFIYYPDHLVRLPGPGQQLWDVARTVLTEPLFKGVIKSIFWEVLRDPRSDDVLDESVGDFLTRRCRSSAIATNIVSAVLHGIYAGDVWQLSMKSLFPQVWLREVKYGDLGSAAVFGRKESWEFCDDLELRRYMSGGVIDPDLTEAMTISSVFTFKEGMEQLPTRFVERLSKNPRVQIFKDTKIVGLTREGASDIKISHTPTSKPNADPEASTFTHAISTINPARLTDMIPEQLRNPSRNQPSLESTLRSTPAVTVGVVNFHFRTRNLLQTLTIPSGHPRNLPIDQPLQGFGYLIPASVPFAQNPERALGVIFDTDITAATRGHDPEPGTRLTVMLGGHWWNDWAAPPTAAECEAMAASVLRRHLGLTELPAASAAAVHRDCIPQYVVGHSSRMAGAHRALDAAFGGRLRVAGSWFAGVGVNDCVRSAWDAVLGLSRDALEPAPGDEPWKGPAKRRTGLERFAWGRPAALMRKSGAGPKLKPGGMEATVAEVIEMEDLGKEMGYLRSFGQDLPPPAWVKAGTGAGK